MPPQEYRKSGLPCHQTKLPKWFQDILLPHPPVLVAVAPIIKIPQPSQPEPKIPAAQVPEFKTEPNSFGIYCIYKSGEPSFTPDDNFHVANISDGPNFIQDPPQARSTWASAFGVGITAVDPPANSKNTPGYLPFKNMSIFCLMQWFYDSSLMKSLGTLNDLVHKVLLTPDFDPKDLNGFDAAREARWLNDDENTSAPATSVKDGWIEMAVPISVPCDNVSHPSEADALVFHVKGLMYHKPLEVIKAAFEDPSAKQLHISPYEEHWQPRPNCPPECIYSELYNSNAFILEHEKVHS